MLVGTVRSAGKPYHSQINTLLGVKGAARCEGDSPWLLFWYDDAIPLTMGLCEKVMANCFVNASYDPVARNGTCPGQIDEFFVGYQWENGGGNNGRQPNFTIEYSPLESSPQDHCRCEQRP